MTGFQWYKSGNSQGEEGYIISFNYDYDLIEKLKSTIPHNFREWNPDKKHWWVSSYCEKQINNLFPGFLEAVRAQRTLF